MISSPQRDIRIVKTQKALAETLMLLMQQKTFQKITVNDICQTALVSRSTFYLHFEDKYQLLLHCLEIEREYLTQKAKDDDPSGFIRAMLLALKERKSAFRHLFQAEIDRELVEMFQSFFSEFFEELLSMCQQEGAHLTAPIPLLAVYYTHGFAGIAMWWIRTDFAYSVEEMTRYHCALLADILPPNNTAQPVISTT